MLDIPALEIVTHSFKESDWTEEVLAFCKAGTQELSVKAIKHAEDQIEAFLEKGHAGRAYNWAFLLIQFTGGAIANAPRFCELFRPTKHEASLSKLIAVLHRLYIQTQKSQLPEAADILASWKAFAEIHAEAFRIELQLLNSLRSTKRSLAWLVCYVEEAFAFHDESLQPPTLTKQRWNDLAKEEAAAAASYLLGRYNHRWKFSPRDFPILQTPSEPPEAIPQFLLQGFFLSEVRSLEPSIFRSGWKCTWVDKHTLHVAHPDDKINMALELGYIKTQFFGVQSAGSKIDERASFREVCDSFQKGLASRIVKVAAEGPRRLQIEIPEPVAKLLCKDLIMTNAVYAEEVRELLSLCWELNTTPSELDAFKVTEHLTLFNLIQISRLFRLLASARNEQLHAMREADRVCYWNSMLGGSPSHKELIRLLTQFGIDVRQAEDYVSLFVWHSQEDGRPLDLQYTSFVPFSDRLAIPFNIHGHSNALRNALIVQRKRLYEDGTTDPVSRELHAALQERTHCANSGVPYHWERERGEFDVIALLDDKLYVFECKNTILPCNAFERRTFWDYLQKAVNQLNRIQKLWRSNEFRTYLAKRLSWPITSSTQLRTCIVPSVRLLSGAQLNGHPIRHNRELSNIIRTGKGTFFSGSGIKYNVNLWRAAEFSTAVLDEYLSEHTELYQPFWNAMHPEWERFEVGDLQILSRRYVLDWEQLEAQLTTLGFIVGPETENV